MAKNCDSCIGSGLIMREDDGKASWDLCGDCLGHGEINAKKKESKPEKAHAGTGQDHNMAHAYGVTRYGHCKSCDKAAGVR